MSFNIYLYIINMRIIKMNKNQTGIILAATIGALFATASMAAENTNTSNKSSNNASVKHLGGSAGNSCGAKNSCKGETKDTKSE